MKQENSLWKVSTRESNSSQVSLFDATSSFQEASEKQDNRKEVAENKK